MLKIRALQIRVVTNGPICGADFSFSGGLNVLRADNSSGKSTCMQAIIYALGLEGMLSAKRDIPLPHAMTDSIQVDGSEYIVQESWVSLEIENSSGSIVTVRRYVKHPIKHVTLIEQFDGPVLTSSLPMETATDFFVRRPGAAQRDSGFHFHLTEFLGWNLPQVSRVDGSEIPLYLECLFPYFFVEQKHGWSGIQARIPTYFMIRDVSRRTAEFILDLDEYEVVLHRQRLESVASQMANEWRQSVDRINGLASAATVILRGVPQKPVDDTAAIYIQGLLASQRGWTEVEEEISVLTERFVELDSIEVPSVEDDAQQLEIELNEAQENLTITTVQLRGEMEMLTESVAREVSLEARIEALEEDLQRHKDVALLRRLGSTHATVMSGDSHCPACQQNLPDGFDITMSPMSPDESIAYIDQELKTFRAMHADVRRAVQIQRTKVRGMRSRAIALQRSIRAIKESLTSASSTPSVAAVAEKIRLQDRIELLKSIQSEITFTTDSLNAKSVAWRNNRQALRALAEQGRSSQDVLKLAFVQSSLRDQLHAYQFTSLDPESIEMSSDTYRPIHEGFDLGFDLSASDMIRVIWAYLLAFLEAGISFSSNHARLLIFDEPRQQETNRLSFAALLDRASQVSQGGAQIIFATSEEEGALVEMLRDREHQLISVEPGSKLIKPLS